jgi:hypothetical protein
MILELYIAFLALAVVSVILGIYTQAPVISIGGYGILFILGVILLLGGLQYRTGTVDTYSYMCSSCVNTENRTQNVTVSFNASQVASVTQTYIYSGFDNEIVQGITIHHFFGFLLSVFSVFGFVSVFLNLGGKSNYD